MSGINDLKDVSLENGESDTEEVYSGGGGAVSVAGHYHVIACAPELKADDGKLKHIEVALDVVAGTAESEVNKKIYHRIYLESWADKANGITGPLKDSMAKGVRRFCHAFGTISDDDLPKKNVPLGFHLLEGKQAVVEVRQEDDWVNDKGETQPGGFKIPFNNAWPVTHPKVEDVPKDPEFLQYAESGQTPGPSDDEFAGI